MCPVLKCVSSFKWVFERERVCKKVRCEWNDGNNMADCFEYNHHRACIDGRSSKNTLILILAHTHQSNYNRMNSVKFNRIVWCNLLSEWEPSTFPYPYANVIMKCFLLPFAPRSFNLFFLKKKTYKMNNWTIDVT